MALRIIAKLLMPLLILTLEGCVAAAGAATNAAVNTAVGVGVSAVRRANGECFTPCNPGSSCNKATGMCDPLPCRGTCNFDEKCQSTYLGDKCVSAKDMPMPSTQP